LIEFQYENKQRPIVLIKERGSFGGPGFAFILPFLAMVSKSCKNSQLKKERIAKHFCPAFCVPGRGDFNRLISMCSPSWNKKRDRPKVEKNLPYAQNCEAPTYSALAGQGTCRLMKQRMSIKS
jgi:hypothetical protein